jgi:hypothetical protein
LAHCRIRPWQQKAIPGTAESEAADEKVVAYLQLALLADSEPSVVAQLQVEAEAEENWPIHPQRLADLTQRRRVQWEEVQDLEDAVTQSIEAEEVVATVQHNFAVGLAVVVEEEEVQLGADFGRYKERMKAAVGDGVGNWVPQLAEMVVLLVA